MATVEAATAALPGASVDAQGPSSASNSTDSSGNYNVAHIYTAGGYNASASADGFLKAYYQTLATVTLGHDTTGVNLNLARSSIVTGQVTGPTGIPVAGATVELVVNNTSTQVGSDTTTSDGLYSIETGVPAGLYQVEVEPPSGSSFFGLSLSCFSYASICPDNPAYLPGFMSRTVPNVNVPAQTQVTQNVQLTRSAAIVGKVTFNGKGVAGVFVTVNGTCSRCYSTTNSTGGYMITNDLPAGTYNVSLSASLYPPLSAHVIATGSALVTATIGGIARHDFTLSASAVVSGYVKDTHGNAVAGATVEIGTQTCYGSTCFILCDGSFLPCATNSTDASGHYVLETGIATGSYNVTASKGSASAGLSSLLSVTAGNSYTPPTIALTVPASVVPAHITGTVKDNHGNPVKFASASGEGVTSHVSNDTETNAQGQFNLEMPLTSTEPVKVTASASGYTSAIYVVTSVAPGGTGSTGTLILNAISPGSISGNVQGQIIASLIQPQRTQKWSTAAGAIISTKTDSELLAGIFGGLELSGNTISTYVQGPEGTSGTFTISIPKSLINPSAWSVTTDGKSVSPTISTNSTYSTITVSYSQGSHILEFAPATTTTTTSSSSTSGSTTSRSSTTSSSTSSTSASSTTSTTSSTSSTSKSSTTAQTTSSSSSSGGGGIPEFPAQLSFTLLATVIIMMSYALARRGLRTHKPAPV